MNTNSGSFCSLASATPLRLIVLVALCLAVAGFGAEYSAKAMDARLGKTAPDEHGVVCYSMGTHGLSCVKVR
jgi:hypothetical protein